jgi:hypothetical protein
MLVPKVGDQIYVPTALYIDHGWDDMHGGLATVSWVGEQWGSTCVRVQEFPGTTYTWDYLYEDQEELEKEFGTSRAHPCPDTAPCPLGGY